MQITVRKNEDAGRYEAVTADDAVAGFAAYQDSGDSIIFPHTVTNPEYRGQGIASQVAKYALDDARSEGKTVVPMCSFFAYYIGEHPEYADLVG